MTPHSLTAAEAEKKFCTSISKGLSSAEAKRRLCRDGKNALASKKRASIVTQFVSQLSDFMIIILLVASALSFVIGIIEGEASVLEPMIILAIVVLNATLGIIQERRAEKSIETLKKLSQPHATVIRDGAECDIAAEDVAVGDILVLRTGDIVAADARLIWQDALMADESGLTGESQPQEKDCAPLPEATALAERANMVMSATAIVGGRGRAIVCATGMNTEVGNIAALISDTEKRLTPLQLRLEAVGKILGVSALAICGVLFVIGILRGMPPVQMFLCAVSLAVAAIPEGLPAIITIMLALGVRKMAKKRAIMKNLPSVETLGGASVVCADKTGTLTENKMSVRDIYAYDKAECIKYATLCCEQGSKNPTEAAIIDASRVMSLDAKKLWEKYPINMRLDFSSKRKRMSTLHRIDGEWVQITKGATDIILPLCTHIKDGAQRPISGEDIRKIRQNTDTLGAAALRVICVAIRHFPKKPAELSEQNLTYIGQIGLIDPPRREAKRSILRLSRAGIKPVMITGDHPSTAFAIAKEIGISEDPTRVCTAEGLDKLSDTELTEAVVNFDVYARATPEHKLRIVSAWQRRADIVAMTGDGVNDAPALTAADIGIAPGIAGTEVAKSAADMIVTDDNIETIAEAVFLGREIFANIKKAVRFLLSSNLGELLVVFLCITLGGSSPLSAIALLWINLITDSLPATALGLDPVDDLSDKNTDIFNSDIIVKIALEGMLIGAITLFSYSLGLRLYGEGVGASMCFFVLSASQLVHAFNMRSEGSVIAAGIFKNKYLAWAFAVGIVLQIAVCTIAPICALFGVAPMNVVQCIIACVISSLPLVISEAQKALNARLRKKQSDKL